MNEGINLTQMILTILGSGALFSFLQFLIQRKDNKESKTLDERFEKLEKKIEEGLDEREKTGSERFEIHEKNIKEMIKLHSEDFRNLMNTFEELKENDERAENTLEQIANDQQNACSALIGIAHDKIVYMTDKITNRGFITLKERATLDSIYQPYKIMGGNSHAKAGYEHVIELEMISDEKANELDDLIKIKRRKEAVEKSEDSLG